MTTEPAKSHYEAVRYNALSHGVLSKLAVLPHEDVNDFENLREALVIEHQPSGPTELHLVEDLAVIMWRKRRILLAENAKINKALHGIIACSTSKPAKSAVPFQCNLPDTPFDWVGIMKSTPEEVEQSQREAIEYRQSIEKILSVLRKGGNKAYEKAVRAMTPDDRETWEEWLEEEAFSSDAEGFREYINTHLWPTAMSMEIEALHHFAIKNQTLGEGLKPIELESLCRYETHLDRKFQRILGMLVKLKEMRKGI
ncbi:MAG: hypothetical protein HGA69_00385 [Desulfobulbaceae bacterium]|nr:hypothetical protein [Desulfobulbaceae bacterium]